MSNGMIQEHKRLIDNNQGKVCASKGFLITMVQTSSSEVRRGKRGTWEKLSFFARGATIEDWYWLRGRLER